jgi:hypothetical protein
VTRPKRREDLLESEVVCHAEDDERVETALPLAGVASS